MDNKKMVTARAHDAGKQVSKREEACFFDFYDPADQQKIADILKEYPNLGCAFFGGNDYCERKMLAVFPKDALPQEEDYEIAVLKIDYKGSISHRDVLGALMGLGISREKTGDIFVGEGHVYLYLKESIADFVLTNLRSVAAVDVVPERVALTQAMVAEPEGKEMSVVVSSMRADAVISAAFKLSRSLALEYIKSDRVKINHQPLVKQMKELKEGDVISVRGKGRAVIEREAGQTKKGNAKLMIMRYR